MNDTYKKEYFVTVECDADNNNIISQVWRDQNGDLNNPIGPAIKRYDRGTGQLMEERWMRNDHTSRLESEGPALILYDPSNGKITKEMYFADGKLHRVYGAAVIHRNSESGVVTHSEYFISNKPVSLKKILPTP